MAFSNKFVKISVEDNGEGIKKNLRDRMFEPYVTSKVKGTGLGLAIVKRTVEDHSGFIRAFPREPRGAKIVIELPAFGINMDKMAMTKLDAPQKMAKNNPEA